MNRLWFLKLGYHTLLSTYHQGEQYQHHHSVYYSNLSDLLLAQVGLKDPGKQTLRGPGLEPGWTSGGSSGARAVT